MLFFRQLQHLLPRSVAWASTKTTKALRYLLEGLSSGPSAARDFTDDVHDDVYPDTTRELELWESQFGIKPTGTDAQRRLAITAAWQAQGGQSPRYIEDVLQAAGFDVYVYEWWVDGVTPTPTECGEPLAASGEPYAQCGVGASSRLYRDPRSYTTAALLGTEQSSALSDQPQCSALSDQPQCNRLLVNEPGYLVNLRFSTDAPPPVPDDFTTWPYFVYLSAVTFPNKANIDAARRREFETLVLKICPAHCWVVTLVNYV